MTLFRQSRHYLIIGGIQWLVDWAVMVMLSHAGVPMVAANIGGRVSGALLGFWLNGRITFAGDDTRVGGRQLGRFIAMWLCTTAVSTAAMTTIDAQLGLKWAWIAKLPVEALLAMVGFVVSRHWVYRR
ncbi:GtrA family protein [Marilutibacter maris]|uniref:GtrA/DPMS transmembrane domain-containing protein n=1 Tax=Marilutibacter maris TaxID=1605891 RepID=A0A2U9T762_9GAMM|nr:GtrA family protein [Lysobacter maris]AWV08546.1 hypothetical protein C9I47_2876 [Lysobacter maris]